MWPGPSCDMGTPCPPPAVQRQSVISVRKRTWAAPEGRQRSPCWPACAHWDPTWLHPMNRAPVLKSHTAGRTGLEPTRRKKYIFFKTEKGKWGEQLSNTSTRPSGGVQILCGKFLVVLVLEMTWKMRRLWGCGEQMSLSEKSRGRGPGWGRDSFPLVGLSVVWGHAVPHWGPEVERECDYCHNTATSVLGLQGTEENKTSNDESKIH